MKEENLIFDHGRDRMTDTLEHFRVENIRLRNENHKFYLAVQRSEQHVSQLLNSRSWKLTLPLRLVSKYGQLVVAAAFNVKAVIQILTVFDRASRRLQRFRRVLRFILKSIGLSGYANYIVNSKVRSSAGIDSTPFVPDNGQISVEELAQMY